jgi:hypothetical protein
MEAIFSSETSVNKIFTRQPIPEDGILQFFYCCLRIRCRSIVFTEPLPSNDRRNIYTDTDRWEGFTQYAIEMSSAAITYILSFIKTGSGIQKLSGAGYTDI